MYLYRSVHFWLIMCNRNIIITWLRSLYDRAWDLLAFRNDAILKITNKLVFVYHVTRVVKPVNSEEIRMHQTGSEENIQSYLKYSYLIWLCKTKYSFDRFIFFSKKCVLLAYGFLVWYKMALLHKIPYSGK